MAIVQAIFALISRSLGRVMSSLFGWAVVALFGATSGTEKIWLSVLVGAAAAWPILLLGVIWPRAAALVLAFVPLPDFVPAWAIRAAWIVLALSVPFALGASLAARSRGTGEPIPGTPGPPPRSPLRDSRALRWLRGVPITVAIAASFLIAFITVPVQRIASIARGRTDVHVPVVTDASAYREVADRIARALARHGFPIEAVKPPWWVDAPSRILRRLGGPSFRDYVPERFAYFRGPLFEIALYPTSLLLRGPEREAARIQGILVEALSDAPAYQTFDPAAQDLERQIRGVWSAFSRNPRAHEGSPWLVGRLDEIARDIRALAVPYDDWQIVYRQALQLERALRGERQLLEETAAEDGAVSHAPEEVPMAMYERNGDAMRVHALSTRELLAEIMDKATRLARTEVDLAKTEIKADLQSQIAMAKGLGIAALAALLGLNLILVSAVLFLAPYIAPWLGALILGGALLLAGGLIAYVSWKRRVAHPLALTRKTLKEDVQWAKEQLA